MSDFRTIQSQMQNDVAEIVLQNPPSNIIDFEMMSQLSEALASIQEARFLKLSTSLPNFSSGVDIRIHTPEHVERMLHEFHSICLRIYNFEGITMAFLQGNALGGGLELALVCDFVFATSSSKLGFPEIALACFPPVASVLLPHLIGKKAFGLIYTGELLTAAKARELGLIDDIIETPEQVEAIFQRLKSYSPHALRTVKKVFRTTGFDFREELKWAEQLYLSELAEHPDTVEGIEAFLQKRKPKYQP